MERIPTLTSLRSIAHSYSLRGPITRALAFGLGRGLPTVVGEFVAMVRTALQLPGPAQAQEMREIAGVLREIRRTNPAAAERIDARLERDHSDVFTALLNVPSSAALKGVSQTPAERAFFQTGDAQASTVINPAAESLTTLIRSNQK